MGSAGREAGQVAGVPGPSWAHQVIPDPREDAQAFQMHPQPHRAHESQRLSMCRAPISRSQRPGPLHSYLVAMPLLWSVDHTLSSRTFPDGP